MIKHLQKGVRLEHKALNPTPLRPRLSQPRQRRLARPTIIAPTQFLRYPLAHLCQPLEINASLRTQTVEAMYQIFCCNIPRRTRTEWTATQPTHRRVKRTNTVFESNDGVDKRLTICVVEVEC